MIKIMRVLQIIKTSDGATWAFNQAKWLVDNGIDIITILPSKDGRIGRKYIENKMKVIEGDFSLPISKPWLYFKRKRQLNEIVKSVNPDIIHFHFVTNILFARLALRKSKVPRLFQVPGPLHLENKIIRKIEFLLARKNDYWAPSCKYSEKIYKSYVSENKVYLAYYGGFGKKTFDNYVSEDILHKEYNISKSSIIVGMVSYFYKPKYFLGQFRGIKGHEDFIDAINILNQKYNNIIAIVVGGPWGSSRKYENRIKRYSKIKGVNNIIFTGFRDDVDKIYKEFDIAVHPSHSENLGGAAESLAAAIPTVSTNVGGFPDIVIDGITGYTCQPKNPKDLAAAIEKMMLNPKLAKKMAKSGKKLVNSLLDINRTSKRILEIYLSILKEEI